MPNPTNKLTYRHFDVQRDFSSLITLLAAVELADRDGEDVSEAALREQLTLPGHDLAQDRWVVLSDNPPQLVGYSVIFKTANDEHADIYVAVHPAWRRQSIGSELLARIVTRARQIRAHDLRSYATAQNHGSAAFLFKHGFHPVSAYTRMTVPGTRSFLVPNFPTGFEVRSYAQVQNREILREAMNRGYEGLWGHHHLSQEEMAAWFPQLTSEGIFLLFAPGERVAGTCRAELSEHLTTLRGRPTGLIDAPGVVAEYRDKDLYLPLVLTALQWLLPQHPASIELESWGDTAATLELYRTLGFALMKEDISYRLNFSFLGLLLSKILGSKILDKIMTKLL